MEFDMHSIETKVKSLFHGKKKWFVIGGIVLVVILFIFMRKRSAANTAYYSGLPVNPETSGDLGGSGGGGGEIDVQGITDQFTKQITDMNKNFTDQITQSNNYYSALFEKQNQAYQEAQRAWDAQMGDLAAGFNQQLADANAQFQAKFAEQDALNQKTLADMNAQLAAAKSQAYSAPSYTGGSSYGNDGGTHYDNYGYYSGSGLQQEKQQVISSGNYSQQTNNYINNVVSAKPGSLTQAAQNAQYNQQQVQSIADKLAGTKFNLNLK